jgi:DNA-binding MarR family transcriptional regulator
LITQAPPELAVWVRLLRGHAGLTGQLSGELQGTHGLSINDYEVLLLLSHADDERLRRVDLAGEVKLSASGITRLLGGLEKRGLVERAPCDTDARVTYAVLTEAGRRKLEEASGPYLKAVSTALTELYSEQELRTLSELLAKLPGAQSEVDPRVCDGG